MVKLIKKSCAVFGGLHANHQNIVSALLFAFGYSIVMTFTIQSDKAVGILFNLIVFTALGAGLKRNNSLFYNLSITGKERVKLAYQTFSYLIGLLLLCKIVNSVVGKFMLLRYTNDSFMDSFYFSEPEMLVFYIVGVYGFCISLGFEFLLFPILFINKKREQVIYFIKITFIAIAPTVILNTIGLQLCKNQEEYQYNSWFTNGSFAGYSKNVLFILAAYAVIFMFVAIVVSMKIAIIQYNKATQQKSYYMQTKENEKKKKQVIWAIIIIIILATLSGISYIGISIAEELGKVNSKEVVGTQLTKDSSFGPMVMEGEVYFPSKSIPELKEEKELGLFTYKGEDGSGILYGLFFSNFAYVDKTDANKTYCIVKGCDYHSYVRADYMEDNFDLGVYKNIVALDIDFLDQQAWADDDSRVGMHDINNELFEKLEEVFGNVAYQAEDFEKIDTYYAIIGTKEEYVSQGDWDSETNFYLNCSDVIGCILVKDGKYYYGNLENSISEELTQEIKMLLAKSKN